MSDKPEATDAEMREAVRKVFGTLGDALASSIDYAVFPTDGAANRAKRTSFRNVVVDDWIAVGDALTDFVEMTR